MKKLFLNLIIGLVGITAVQAQDVHYVHAHAAPVYFNPAMTGIINNGNIRLVTNARSQWSTITNGYNTILASADMQATSLGNSILGVGLQILSDKAGDLSFGTTAATLSTSVLLPLSKHSNFISFGFSNSLVNKSIDLSRLSGEELEPLIGTISNNVSYWDVSAGGTYFQSKDELNFFYFGGAVAHVNKPSASFGTSSSSVGEVAQKITANLGGSTTINSVIALQPSIVFMKQGSHNQVVAGSFIKFSKTVFTKNRKIMRGQSAFYAGSWLRYSQGVQSGIDAVITAMRADFGQTSITFSFDVNISGLAATTRGFGAPELSVSYTIDSKNIKRRLSSIECPAL